MTWPPHFELDLVEAGLLPDGWSDDVRAAATDPDTQLVIGDANSDWRFSVLMGGPLRARLDWLGPLYHGALLDFVSRSFGMAVFPSNRISSSSVLNNHDGIGAEAVWHTDSNPVTGVLFVAQLGPQDGGTLEFRDGEGRHAAVLPRPGLFVCFPGRCEHRVTPLRVPGPRLAIPMIWYTSQTDQPFASEHDRYL